MRRELMNNNTPPPTPSTGSGEARLGLAGLWRDSETNEPLVNVSRNQKESKIILVMTEHEV
jgi:hypothetical protein